MTAEEDIRDPDPSVNILSTAWILFVVSIFAPAFFIHAPVPPFVFLGYVPVGFIVPGAVINALQEPLSWFTPVAISYLFFIVSPFALWRIRAGSVAFRFAAAGPLLVWVFPIALEFVVPGRQKLQWGFQHLGWGFYLEAAAQTLASIAMTIARTAPKAVLVNGVPMIPSK